MIDIKIFDVDHGFCAVIDTHDHHMIMIDCGYNSHTKFRPSQYAWERHCTSIDCLIMPAYTEDHLANFSALFNELLSHSLPVNCLISNPSINPEQFPQLELPKRRLENILTSMEKIDPECGLICKTMEIDGITLSFFWNNYPDFQDAHNLSLVTFVSYRDIKMIFPSDLETTGWRTLLQCADFRDHLRRVNVFVASNHGREKGYCPEVFNYCQPEVVIISNEGDKPVSAEMISIYENHAQKLSFGISDKKLLMTRDHGTITISKYLDSLLNVKTQKTSSSVLKLV